MTLAEAICPSCGYPLHAPNGECWYTDLGTCAYYRGEGTCSYGCSTEPSCFTGRPCEGWPCERAAHSEAASNGGSPPAWCGPIGTLCDEDTA